MTKAQFQQITEARKEFYKLKDVTHSFSISRSAWYRGVQDGRYPSPIKLSERSSAWRGSDLDKLADLLSKGQDWRNRT